MEWIILFVVSWILLILLVDLKELKKNIWCGLTAVSMQLMVDTNAMTHKLYSVENPVVHISGSSLLFVLGPVFVIGVLLSQFQPMKRWKAVLYVVVLTALYSIQELFLTIRKVLIYHNWHFVDSLVVNLSAIIVISWVSIVVVKKGSIK